MDVFVNSGNTNGFGMQSCISRYLYRVWWPLHACKTNLFVEIIICSYTSLNSNTFVNDKCDVNNYQTFTQHSMEELCFVLNWEAPQFKQLAMKTHPLTLLFIKWYVQLLD